LKPPNNRRQIVTLTTDWVDKSYYVSTIEKDYVPKTYPIGDHYVAQLKGVLKQISQDIEIVDISHSVQAFNAIQAGFVLRSAFRFYPEGTIHIVGVNSEPSPSNKLILIKYMGHYFIGANDGMFSLVFEDNPDTNPEFVLELPLVENFYGFSALMTFAFVVRHLTNQKEPSMLGKPCEMIERPAPSATYNDNFIYGRVVFVDHFGNLITNISRELFETVRDKRPFRIVVNTDKLTITQISSYYDDVAPNQYLALFNSNNILEIAKRNSNLAQLENLDTKTSIVVEFSNDKLFFN